MKVTFYLDIVPAYLQSLEPGQIPTLAAFTRPLTEGRHDDLVRSSFELEIDDVGVAHVLPQDGRHSSRLVWHEQGGYLEAILGDFDAGDGARFTLQHFPTCMRRGQWRLLVEVSSSWGCFDDADEPQRWYHSRERAFEEAQAIADAVQPKPE